MDIDRRTNGDKRGDIDKATIGEVKKGNNKDKNIGRGENKSKNVRGNGEGERVNWEVQPDQHSYPYSLFHSYILILIIAPIFFIISIYLLSQALYENFLD